MNGKKSKTRYYYMDSMRSVLMCLVVFYHIGNIYMYKSTWIVSDQNSKMYIFNIINEIMPLFRMPGFFIISGFFTMFSLRKYGSLTFLKLRLSRVVIPLVSTAATLNTAQSYFQYSYINGNKCTFFWYLQNKLLTTWTDGSWVSHLWFLNCLIIYFLFSALSYSIRDNVHFEKLKFFSSIIEKLRTKNRFLLVFPLFMLSFFAIGKVFPFFIWGDIFNAISMYQILQFAPFFFFGFWLFADEKLQKEFCGIHNWTFPALVLAFIIFRNTTSATHGILENVLHIYAKYLISWIMVNYCFYLFYRFFNDKSDIFKFLSDSAYTIYLFHHIIVISIGYWLIQFDLVPIMKFLIVLCITLFITVTIHIKIVARNRIVQFVFNGK